MPIKKGDEGPSPRLLELRLTKDPRSPMWQLRAGGAGVSVALLGWVLDRSPLDAGVPAEAAGIIARAACRSHLLTFLHPLAAGQAESSRWTEAPWGWACVLDPPAWKRALGKPRFPLMATSDPDTAAELFCAECFNWELRGQAVLLSACGSPPPPLEYDHLERLFRKEPLNRVSTRLPKEFTGLLLPGIDGDFVELAAFEEAGGKTVGEAMALECAKARIGWKIVSETEFAETRWHGEH